MSRDEWIAQFAAKAGVKPPTAEQVTQLLDLAATAAHASERPAAPLACWVAGRSSLSAEQLLAAASSISTGA